MISPKLFLILSVGVVEMSVQGFGTLNAPAMLRSERSSAPTVPGLSLRAGDDAPPVIPEECMQLGICDQSLGYKDDVVDRVIQDLINQNKEFNNDVLEPPQLSTRLGSNTQELCASREQIYVPRLAQDANKQWHRIVNAGSSQQTFRVEICEGQINPPCSSIAVFQEGYQSQCVQKYVLRNMIALSTGDEVIEKPFLVPSCCSCAAKSL